MPPAPSATPTTSTTPVPSPVPAPIVHTLTFNRPEHGSIQLADQLNCGRSGTDCEMQAQAGTSVTVQATAEADYLVQQSSCGDVSNGRLTIRLDSSRNCTVTFVRDPRTIPAPAKTPVATPGPTAAEIAIEDVIARYVKAMASLKSSEVSPLYESYSGSNRETVESLFRTYSSVQWIKTGPAKIEFSADGREATARIAGTKTLVNMRTRNQTTGGLSAEFQLVLTPAGWKIRTFRHLN